MDGVKVALGSRGRSGEAATMKDKEGMKSPGVYVDY